MNVRADFWLKSENCTIDLQSSVFSANAGRESKALYYSLMVTLMCLAHLFATVQVIKNIAQNEHDGGRYSLISLCFLTIWDVFMCLFHLYNALTTEVDYYCELGMILIFFIGFLPLFHYPCFLVLYPLINFRNKTHLNCLENSLLSYLQCII